LYVSKYGYLHITDLRWISVTNVTYSGSS